MGRVGCSWADVCPGERLMRGGERGMVAERGARVGYPSEIRERYGSVRCYAPLLTSRQVVRRGDSLKQGRRVAFRLDGSLFGPLPTGSTVDKVGGDLLVASPAWAAVDKVGGNVRVLWGATPSGSAADGKVGRDVAAA